jgi:hypothetical protein
MHSQGRAASPALSRVDGPRRPVLVKEEMQRGGFGETALPYKGVEFE